MAGKSSTGNERNNSHDVPLLAAERPGPQDALAPASLAAARALGQPSRRRIVEALTREPDGLTALALAERLGLHHNAVRQHLAVLAGVGLVTSRRDAPRGRGRPSIRYRAVGGGSRLAAGHQELVRLLVGLVRRAGFTSDEVEAFGYEQGLAIGRSGGGAEAIVEAFAQLGFAPEETSSAADRAAGRLSARLQSCPFRDAV